MRPSSASICRSPDGTAPEQLTVYFDGGCPVCVMEVGYYRRIDKANRVSWIDIGALTDAEIPEGKNREDLLGIFHVQNRNGAWVIGVDAFAAIWRELPGFRHFSWTFKAPALRQAAGVFYRAFLLWQKQHRLKRKRCAQSGVPAQ